MLARYLLSVHLPQVCSTGRWQGACLVEVLPIWLQAVQVLHHELALPDQVEVRQQHPTQRPQQRRIAQQPPHEALHKGQGLLCMSRRSSQGAPVPSMTAAWQTCQLLAMRQASPLESVLRMQRFDVQGSEETVLQDSACLQRPPVSWRSAAKVA